MNYCPLVTIVIPVYNGSNYLKEAIESALAQSYKNIEIIVVDDGSNDDGKTENIAKSFGNSIRYISKENGGVSSALNVAIKEMRGEWLSWLSHDDLYKPNKIEIQIQALELLRDSTKDIRMACVYSATERINADGHFISRKKFNVPSYSNPIDTLLYNIKNYSICGCTVLMSKYVLDKIGGFDENLRTVSDADLWFRMMMFGCPFYYVDEIVVQSRQHNQQVGNRCLKLFENEHSALMNKITLDLLNYDSLTESQKYRLFEGLIWNGFNDAGKIVKDNLINSNQFYIGKYIRINFYSRTRRVVFVTLRYLYRKITLK